MSLSFVAKRDRLNKVPLQYSGDPPRPPVTLIVIRPEGEHSILFPLHYNEEVLQAYIHQEAFLEIIHRLNSIIKKKKSKKDKKDGDEEGNGEQATGTVADQIAAHAACIPCVGIVVVLLAQLIPTVVSFVATKIGKNKHLRGMIKYLNHVNKDSEDLKFVLSKNFRGQGYALSIEIEAVKVKSASASASASASKSESEFEFEKPTTAKST